MVPTEFITGDANLEHSMMWCLLGFATESCSFPLSVLRSLGVTRLVLTQWGRENKVPHRRGNIYRYYLEFFYKEVCLLSPFIIQSPISMDLCDFFYTLGYNPILCYIFCCSNCCSLATGRSFRLAPVSLWHAAVLSPILSILAFDANFGFLLPPSPLRLL